MMPAMKEDSMQEQGRKSSEAALALYSISILTQLANWGEAE